MPHMPAPVAGRDLVLDQRVDRIGVRHAQQRLGQTHQRDTLIGAEPVFRQEDFHHARGRSAADIPHELCRMGRDFRTLRARQIRVANQFIQNLAVIGVGRRIDMMFEGCRAITCHGKALCCFDKNILG